MKFFTEMLYDTEHGVVEFHFEHVGYSAITDYKVAMTTGINTCCHFIMKEKDRKWTIVDASNLPEWVIALEDELSDSIYAHRTRTTTLT